MGHTHYVLPTISVNCSDWMAALDGFCASARAITVARHWTRDPSAGARGARPQITHASVILDLYRINQSCPEVYMVW